MDYAATPAPPRRILGRMLPWAMALGLFAAGGFGVYRFAAPGAAALAADAAAYEVAPRAAAGHAALTDKHEIQQLFSATLPTDAATAASDQPVALGRPADRYTARLGAAVDASTGSLAEGQTAPAPAETAPRPSVAPLREGPGTDAAMMGANPLVEHVASPTPAAAAPPEVEVARGQEPTPENPLRTGVAAGSPAARAAFAEPAPTAQPAASSEPAAAAALEGADATAATGNGGNPFARYSRGAPPAAVSSNRDAAPTAASMFSADQAAPVAQSAAGAEPIAADLEPAPVEPVPQADAAPARFAPLSAKPLRPQAATAPPDSTAVNAAEPPAPATSSALLSESPAGAGQSVDAAPLGPPDAAALPGAAAIEGAGRPGDHSLEGPQAPTLVIQKLTPAEVQVGKKCTFAVKVQNTGRLAAQSVQIHDEVPLGAQLVGSAPKANVDGARLTWDLGTLAAGEERIVEMELMPVAEGELGSVATVTFAAQASAKVRCTRPELELRLSAGPRVMIGQQHVVEIEIANPGSGDASGVMLLENVPAGVTHEAGPALEFEVGTLKAGESRRLDLVLTAAEAGRINNVMTARADAGLEVQAGCEFEVVAPKLAVSVEGPSRRYLERPATYTVNIENPGTAAAKEVQLVTQLPPGLKFVSANNLGEYDAATHSVHWSLAELPANERGTVELTALPVAAGEHTLQIASRAEQGLEERTETRLLVEGIVALSFDIDAADGAVEVGGDTAFDVTVVNHGSKPAANVQVVAAIPQGLRAIGGQGATRHVVEGDRVVFAPVAQLPPKGEAKFRIQLQGLAAGDQRTRIMVTADEVQQPITKEESTRVYADQ
ncbi:MAG: DUF11 domain-containing protein [Pirellulales bacterium]|nr:DUF11 domain-containing protein [Pirellulales bacterium]